MRKTSTPEEVLLDCPSPTSSADSYQVEYIEQNSKRGSALGTFNWPIRLESMDGARSLETEVVVGTDTRFTILPGHLLRDMGISPTDKVSLMFNAVKAQHDIGRARAFINGRSIPTLVIFGADDARALLGAYTLEGLRLAVDPTHARVIPATTAWA